MQLQIMLFNRFFTLALISFCEKKLNKFMFFTLKFDLKQCYPFHPTPWRGMGIKTDFETRTFSLKNKIILVIITVNM